MPNTPACLPYTEEEKRQLLSELFSEFEQAGLSEADVDDMAVILWEDGAPQPKVNFHDL